MSTLRLYRLTKSSFLHDLSGEGARLYGGRWNRKGDAMLYFSEHLSLCVLELLTRIDYEFITKEYSFIEAEVPSSSIVNFSKPESVSKIWRANPPASFTQDFGSAWIAESASLGMSVPSAVLPSELNILINPKHQLISKLKVIKSSPLDLDSRVLQ
jgi:RES domain-containing protein